MEVFSWHLPVLTGMGKRYDKCMLFRVSNFDDGFALVGGKWSKIPVTLSVYYAFNFSNK